MPPLFSIVIPAYNEENRITTTLGMYFRHFMSRKSSFEIIVVCDGSTDRTAQIVRNFRKPNVRVLESEKRLGKGGGIMAGFRASKGKFLGFTDADGSVGPEDFYSMLDTCRRRNCAVIGSRNLMESKITKNPPFYRHLLSNIFSAYVNALFGLGISDTQCGAKAMPRGTALGILNTRCTGFEFDVEMLWRIKNTGANIIEFPVAWSHGDFSTFTIKSGPRMAFNLLMARIRK